MIRTSKHNIDNISNKSKLNNLDIMFDLYKKDLIIYIDLIINGKLPLKKLLSSKELPSFNIKHSKYKRDIYKLASEIIRSNIKKSNNKRYYHYKKIYKYFIQKYPDCNFVKLKYSELNLKDIIKTKYFIKPNINNLTINLTNEFFDIKYGNYFDNFVNIKLPIFNENGTRLNKINLPLKQHKHSNSLLNNGFKLKNTIQIKQINDKYFINLIWFKEDIEKKKEGKTIGIDIGYKKLIVTSDGDFIGSDMVTLYEKISNKRQGSNNFKQSLIERDNLINYYVNQLDLSNINKIVIEELHNVKHKNKLNKKLQRWSYKKLIDKIERTCEVNGIELAKVSPAYTSQRCSNCGHIDKKSRNGEIYHCVSCGYKIDADLNASINIHNRGIYSFSNKKVDIKV